MGTTGCCFEELGCTSFRRTIYDLLAEHETTALLNKTCHKFSNEEANFKPRRLREDV